MESFLVARHVTKRYGGVLALEDVSIAIARGEIHCLVGQNGSGKSTFVKILTGVVQPDPGGEIQIAGQPVARLTPEEALRRGIQVVHQDLSLFPNLTVAENVATSYYTAPGRRLVRWGEVRRIARDALDRIGVALPLDAPLGELPLADRQLVAIARALASDAKLIILDEPTSSLTRREVDRLMGVIHELRERGIATLFISHKLDEVLAVAQTVTVLRDGRTVGTFPRDQVDRNALVRLMVGRDVSMGRPEPASALGPPVLEVRGLRRRTEFADVTFTLRAGEILGLIGPLGSGRTELALALFGMIPPDEGTVVLEGRPVLLRSSADAIRAGIALVPEDRLRQGIVLTQSVANNVVLTAFDQVVERFGLLSPKRRDALAETAVRTYDIKAPSISVPARVLSGGNQQKVVIAKWLQLRPKVLILDSPTAGIDVGSKEHVYEIVRALARQGVGILLISDEIPEVLSLCHRVLVMKSGRVVGAFDSAALNEDSLSRLLSG